MSKTHRDTPLCCYAAIGHKQGELNKDCIKCKSWDKEFRRQKIKELRQYGHKIRQKIKSIFRGVYI